jgi:hypothetical protein
VESVVNQTWQGFHIVIDGGFIQMGVSPTLKVKQPFWLLGKWAKMRVYTTPWIKGITKTTGEYSQQFFLNSGTICIIHKHFFRKKRNKIHIGNQGFNLFWVDLVKGQIFSILTYQMSLQFSHFIFGALPHKLLLWKGMFENLVWREFKLPSDWGKLSHYLFINVVTNMLTLLFNFW